MSRAQSQGSSHVNAPWYDHHLFGIPTLQAFPSDMQYVVTRERVTGWMAGAYRRVLPIEAEVLRVARGVEQPLSADWACVCAGPDVHCFYAGGEQS